MKNRNVVRPKHYDRPGHRSQTASTADLRAPAAEDFDWDLITEGEEWSPYEKEVYRRSHVIEPEDADPYDIFNQLTAGEKQALDPTIGYGAAWQDGRDGRPIRGSSPEYEDGYLAGLKVRGETVQ
jgi:hypothetical protein